MARVPSPLDRATTPTALTRIAQFDYWLVRCRLTGAEVAVTVDRSVPLPTAEGRDVGRAPLRVVGFLVVLDGSVVTDLDRLPAACRATARDAVVWGRATAIAASRRRGHADRLLASAGVGGGVGS